MPPSPYPRERDSRGGALVRFAVWWALLAGAWLVFSGVAIHEERIAAALAGAVGAAAALAVVTVGHRAFEPDPRRALRALKVPHQALLDFAVVTLVLVRALARGERVEGELVAAEFDAGDAGARDAWWRAFATVASTATPNAIVLDVLPGAAAVLHSLDVSRKSGRVVL